MTRTQTASIIFVFALTIAAIAGPPAFEINWHTVDGGGGTSTGGGFTLSGTAGQHDAGALMTGGGFTLTGGFWPGVGINCIGDTDNDGDVDINDLRAVILNWNTSAGPPDVNYDGTIDINDLRLVILNWGPCP